MIEDGSEVMTKEEIEQQLARLEKYMIDLQNALLKIENKTYGICTVTGKLIPKEQLRSVPHATKSIEAKINRD
jgi:RNA polymerase-binding transcription factor DksA